MSLPSAPAPPTSTDPNRQTPIELNPTPIDRPPEIELAFWSVIASAVLGAISFVARGLQEPPLIAVGVLAVLAAFAFLIRAGKNWARIVYLIFFLIGLSSLFVIRELIALNGMFFFAIFCLQTVLQGYAAWLVFRPPGSRWFRRARVD